MDVRAHRTEGQSPKQALGIRRSWGKEWNNRASHGVMPPRVSRQPTTNNQQTQKGRIFQRGRGRGQSNAAARLVLSAPTCTPLILYPPWRKYRTCTPKPWKPSLFPQYESPAQSSSNPSEPKQGNYQALLDANTQKHGKPRHCRTQANKSIPRQQTDPVSSATYHGNMV